MREKLTTNNLKTIVAKKLSINRDSIRLIRDNNEVTGHKKLIDIGLVDGDILEAKTTTMRDDLEQITRSV